MTVFKNNSGQFYTRQLFWEESIQIEAEKKRIEPPFCLHESKHGLISFRDKYVELGDPTGYKITQELLGGNYRHWQELLKCKWFVAAKKEWDVELDAKLASEGLDKIRETAQSDDKQALVAARYLANKEYREKVKTTRGRPSKDELSGELKRMSAEEKAIFEDAERIKAVK